MPRDAENVWQPFQPTATDPWDAAKVVHLHSRAGFGATRHELDRDLADGPDASVQRFLEPEVAAHQAAISRVLLSQADDLRSLQAWWMQRMLWGGDPLREKLTLFWHDHFATSQRKIDDLDSMAAQNQTLRARAMGSWAQLLGEMTADPAMLVWLDGITSRRDQPNENYAREFFELFTLGIGHYSERDIQEAARAFTGWRPKQRGSDKFHFDADEHDDADKEIFGRRAAFDAAELIDWTLEQTQAARWLCTKLYRFFVSEVTPPQPEWIDALAAHLRESEFSIGAVVERVLRSRLFFSRHARAARVKSPIEWCLGISRALEVPREQVRLLAVADSCQRQGQSLFEPPSVAGWDWGAAWLTSTAMIERTNWTARILWGSEDYGIDPIDLEARLAGDSVEGLAALLLPGADAAANLLQDAKGDTPLLDRVHLLLSVPELHLA